MASPQSMNIKENNWTTSLWFVHLTSLMMRSMLPSRTALLPYRHTKSLTYFTPNITDTLNQWINQINKLSTLEIAAHQREIADIQLAPIQQLTKQIKVSQMIHMKQHPM